MSGFTGPDRVDRLREDRRATVGQVVAGDTGDDSVRETHRRHRVGDTPRLVASTGSGLRVSIWQKPQARVQRSPRIMNVAVRSAQHS